MTTIIEGALSKWHRMPLDVWSIILDFVQNKDHLIGDFTDSPLHIFRLSEVFFAEQNAMKTLVRSGTVCRSWRRMTLPRLYRNVFLTGTSKMHPFRATLLESSNRTGLRNDADSLGYGRWVQELGWVVYHDTVMDEVQLVVMEEILRLCPNLLTFSPLVPGRTHIPPRVWTALSQTPSSRSLKTLHIQGEVKFSDLSVLFSHTPYLDTLTLAFVEERYPDDPPQDHHLALGNVRNLNLFIQKAWDRPILFIEVFSQVALPKLENLTMKFSQADYVSRAPPDPLLPFFQAHGSKLQTLEFVSFLSPQFEDIRLPDITQVLGLCENVTVFAVHCAWFMPPMRRIALDNLPKLKRFDILGLHLVVTWSQNYSLRMGRASPPNAPPTVPLVTFGFYTQELTLEWSRRLARLFCGWVEQGAELVDVIGISLSDQFKSILANQGN